MNDVTFDFGRAERIGFPEIIYGEHKSPDQLRRIVRACDERQLPVLISRLQVDKATLLSDLDGDYDPVARTWMRGTSATPPQTARVGVVSAGTADAPVVAECLNTLKFLGISAISIQDVGVAGVHRLLARLDELRACRVVICVAGFEGALASVVAGQLGCPVIGVPTSVGYGVAAQGHTALHAMLASCANGLMVMNIDNGVGAALAARRILGDASTCTS